ncbi:MAG: HlyD family secretion protein, partial [Burkholderiales bacterium]
VMTLARMAGLRVLLGIEPSDSFAVRPGMPVRLTPVFDAPRQVETRVSAVHGMVDPQTQLVDVEVRIAAGRLLPGMRVKGEITLATRTGWAVPRSAVLRDGDGDYLFQVKDGVARRVAVRVDSDGDRLLGISGAGLDPSLKVVVQGNYELADGMAVREAAQ